jgi:hypothetical protein
MHILLGEPLIGQQSSTLKIIEQAVYKSGVLSFFSELLSQLEAAMLSGSEVTHPRCFEIQ